MVGSEVSPKESLQSLADLKKYAGEFETLSSELAALKTKQKNEKSLVLDINEELKILVKEEASLIQRLKDVRYDKAALVRLFSDIDMTTEIELMSKEEVWQSTNEQVKELKKVHGLEGGLKKKPDSKKIRLRLK
jgi:hypothetical protein